MIKVEKQVSITIDGEDIQSLSDVCEMARRYINLHKTKRDLPCNNSEWIICNGEYDNKAYCRIDHFLDRIFSDV